MDRIQKVIAHAGICSRRKAEELIKEGKEGEKITLTVERDGKEIDIEVERKKIF